MNRTPHILVVTASASIFKLLGDTLREVLPGETHRIEKIPEGTDPAKAVSTRKPDLIFVDETVGSLSGLEVIKAIREADEGASVVILLTHGTFSDFPHGPIEWAALGLDDVLPLGGLSKESLGSRVYHALQLRKQRSRLNDQTRTLESVLKASGSVIWSQCVEDPANLYVSQSVEELTGFSKEAFESRKVKWIDRVVEEDRERVRAIFTNASRETATLHYRFRCRDGQLIWIEDTFSLAEDPLDPRKMVISGRVQDVTEKLRHEEQMRLLMRSVEQSKEAILITAADLEKPGPEIVFVNEAMSEMSGYSPEELVGQTPRILQGPRTDDQVLKELKEALAAGRGFEGSTWNHRKDGTPYLVRWQIKPVKDEAGRTTHFLSTQQDITDAHFREQELLRQQNFLREIGNFAKIGGWHYYKTTDKVYWTDPVYKIHGMKPEEGPVNLETALSFYPEKARRELQQVFDACITEGTPFDQVFDFTNADGRKLVTRSCGEPVYENGEISGAWGVFQDISAFYKLQYENEIFYDLAVELTCKLSLDGIFLTLNKQWEETLGYPMEDFTGHSFMTFVHEDDKARLADIFEKVSDGEDEVNGLDVRAIKKDGTTVYLSCNAVLSPYDDTVFLMARDITDLKLKEVQLEQALSQANIANESKNQFLMVMSHELRTPLNPILGCADLLLDRTTSEDDREMLELIVESANHLSSVISDILDISSIEAGRMSIQKEPFELIEAVESSIRFLKARAIAKGLQLEFENHGQTKSAEAVYCIGDKRKLRQILINLLGNAVKFTHEGMVRLELLPFALKAGLQTLVIEVNDTGIGISEEDQKTIFNRFHQVKMNESREFQGQGLGLALCREMARLMKGDVTVTSTPGKGSTFTLTLPVEILIPEEEERNVVGTELTPVKGEADKRTPLPPTFRILVAEDDPLNQTVLKGMLSRMQADFLLVDNGLSAVEAARETAYDLILMDIQMPIMDGMEATRQIRALENPNQKTPILAISAHAVDEVKRDSLKSGMSGFLEKPIEFNTLKETLKAVSQPKHHTG